MDTVFLSKADFVGQCRKCKEPSTGSFYSDDDCDEDSNAWVTMKCVNCNSKDHYCFDPDIHAVLELGIVFDEEAMERFK